MLPLEYDKLVLSRVRTQRHFLDWRRSVHSMRCLLAGDREKAGMGRSQQEANPPARDSGRFGKSFGDEEGGSYYEEFFNVVSVSVAEGLSNRLWHAVKNLCFETAFRMPEVDFEDLSAEAAAVNSSYLKAVLGTGPCGCDAVGQMRMALLDYMVSGYGFVAITLDPETGRPGVQWVDSLDLTWDVGQTLVSDAQWVSRTVRLELWRWVDMFGAKAFSHLLEGNDVEVWDEVVSCEFYYDVIGERGHHYVLCASLPEEQQVIFEGENPFYKDVDGILRPYLPIVAIYFMQLPSVRFAMGLVGNMLPHQLAIWTMERNFNETLRRGIGHFVVEEGALSPDQRKLFDDSQVAKTITIAQGKQPPKPVEGLEIKQSEMAYYELHTGELVSQSGLNPYSGGSRVEGVEFASEVSAINAKSSLTSGVIAKDHADHWRRVASLVLWAGMIYDTSSYEFQHGEVRLVFNDELPIREFLQPVADVVVREESAAFRPRVERIQEAMLDIDQALKLSAVYPGLLQSAAEEWLRAKGEKDIARLLAAPAMADPAAAPGEGPASAQSDLQ